MKSRTTVRIPVAHVSRSWSALDGNSTLNAEDTFNLSGISAAQACRMSPKLVGTSVLNTEGIVRLREYLNGRQTGVDFYR